MDDEEKANSFSNEREERDFMIDLAGRCTRAIDDHSTNSHIMACHLISESKTAESMGTNRPNEADN